MTTNNTGLDFISTYTSRSNDILGEMGQDLALSDALTAKSTYMNLVTGKINKKHLEEQKGKKEQLLVQLGDLDTNLRTKFQVINSHYSNLEPINFENYAFLGEPARKIRSIYHNINSDPIFFTETCALERNDTLRKYEYNNTTLISSHDDKAGYTKIDLATNEYINQISLVINKYADGENRENKIVYIKIITNKRMEEIGDIGNNDVDRYEINRDSKTLREHYNQANSQGKRLFVPKDRQAIIKMKRIFNAQNPYDNITSGNYWLGIVPWNASLIFNGSQLSDINGKWNNRKWRSIYDNNGKEQILADEDEWRTTWNHVPQGTRGRMTEPNNWKQVSSNVDNTGMEADEDPNNNREFCAHFWGVRGDFMINDNNCNNRMPAIYHYTQSGKSQASYSVNDTDKKQIDIIKIYQDNTNRDYNNNLFATSANITESDKYVQNDELTTNVENFVKETIALLNDINCFNDNSQECFVTNMNVNTQEGLLKYLDDIRSNYVKDISLIVLHTLPQTELDISNSLLHITRKVNKQLATLSEGNVSYNLGLIDDGNDVSISLFLRKVNAAAVARAGKGFNDLNIGTESQNLLRLQILTDVFTEISNADRDDYFEKNNIMAEYYQGFTNIGNQKLNYQTFNNNIGNMPYQILFMLLIIGAIVFLKK